MSRQEICWWLFQISTKWKNNLKWITLACAWLVIFTKVISTLFSSYTWCAKTSSKNQAADLYSGCVLRLTIPEDSLVIAGRHPTVLLHKNSNSVYWQCNLHSFLLCKLYLLVMRLKGGFFLCYYIQIAHKLELPYWSWCCSVEGKAAACDTGIPSGCWKWPRKSRGRWPNCLGPHSLGWDLEKAPGYWFQSGPALGVVPTHEHQTGFKDRILPPLFILWTGLPISRCCGAVLN